jgi:integrase
MAAEKKSVMSFKNLQLYLNSDTAKRGVSSAITLGAQTRTLLQPNDLDILPIIGRANELLLSNTLPRVLLAVIELQLFYGLRISECLNITTSDISNTGHIRIRGAKGSNDRIVIPYKFASFWQNEAKAILPIGKVYSRFWFYRQYKNLGLYAIFGNSKVKSVTHLFRHLNILSLKESFNETDLTRKFIGHKSIKSTMHYERKKKL